jgi:two-component system phosphate regulon sensor histidine kinase PhoR
MFSTLLAALFLVCMVIFAFYFAVSTIFKQKHVSEIKNDFISNMTHELKTPISTISLACEAIEDPDIKNDPATLSSFVNMIASENKRLGTLVEKVLQTSLLEKGKLNLQLAQYSIN